ncbi:DUF421 domain-containing protein [Alkaliphilus peptidifermentans]|uniref:Uncharacterized membrane protein YcaP, DUF421 family n=1 Tax=Alkaliphilus peptidifermentans DSM 18978 TaxID=1120976 RepID=A0A1G5FMR3_9FIRM|nr:DUF421 domain-containing protein [Alkaliphilus peptidifermentans]SCY40434.1 Uncharacterized membrane protein YcaP, DUF421 family [Alkaliphilus peptidifermentans DSM 18978]
MEYLMIFIRIITIMSLVLFLNLILTGKRLVGEMPVFDFLIIITMGSVIGADIADPSIEHLPTAFAIVILAIFQYIMNKFILKNRKFARIVTFEPTLVMENGKFLVNNMKKIKYSIDELLMMLREKDIFDFKDVLYAIIESNGRMTVLKKADINPVTPKDMAIGVKEKEVPTIVILEGRFDTESLKRAGLKSEMILDQVKKAGYKTINEIFIATYSKDKQLHISPYHIGIDSKNIQH